MSGKTNANTGSRKHNVATAHSSPDLPVAAEGRFEKATSVIQRVFSNSTATVTRGLPSG
jgi:hypothetical protein